MTLDEHRTFIRAISGQPLNETTAYRLYAYYLELLELVDASLPYVAYPVRAPHPLYPDEGGAA